MIDAAEAIPVPAKLSWEEASCIPLTFLVAFDMLVLQGRLQPGEWLLVNGVSNKLRTKVQRAAAVPRFTAEVVPHFAAGRIRPQIDCVYEFGQLAQAKARMEAGGHVGKIVLRMPATA